MAKVTKLIDLKAEYAEAQDRVSLFCLVREQFVESLKVNERLDQDFLLDTLLEETDMTYKEFIFIRTIELQEITNRLYRMKKK